MIGTDLQRAKDFLLSGQLVAIPTETVYGLAGNAYDERAVAEIFRVKNRPQFDPLIVHTTGLERAAEFLQAVPSWAKALAGRFMPGPLTLLLPRNDRIPDLVTSGSSLVAVRLPRHPQTRALLEALPFPLAAPSANPFGYISPTTARHVADQLGDRIPYILDGGPCTVGIESTIVGFEDDRPVVFRKGGVSIEAIEAVIGPVVVRAHSTSNPQAPGMLKSHYAPRVPLVLAEEGKVAEAIARYRDRQVGVISFSRRLPELPADRQAVLSSAGDYAEAARHLFAALRELDALPIDLIVAELLPEVDLGRAINDRLRRAAAG